MGNSKQLDGYGVRAGGNDLVQVPYDAAEETVDDSGNGVISPVTISAIQAFAVPAGATMFIFGATGDARYGNNSTLDGSGTGKGYRKYHEGAGDAAYPCAGSAFVYVLPESGSIEVDFTFERTV